MDLSHDRRGSGEPLVLLHGIGSRWQVFAPVIDALAAHHEVWSVDLPGFGASPPAPRADIPGLTEAIAEWIDERGIERPHVAGNSTGAGIALELAARGAVASATALAPIGFWSRRERAFCQLSLGSVRALLGPLRPGIEPLMQVGALRSAFLWQYYARPGRVTAEEAVASQRAFAGAPSFDETLAAFTGYVAPAQAADDVPVTIVWGDRDRLLLSRQSRRARRLLPRARHVMVDHAGHVLMSDAPEATVDAILATTRCGPERAPA